MKIRAMGAPDLIQRLNDLLQQFNASGKIYNNRGNSKDKRLYLDFDDRAFENLLYTAEDGISDLRLLRSEKSKRQEMSK